MSLKLPFVQDESNTFAQNRLLKFGFSALLLVTVFNTWSVHSLKDNMRTAVLPPFSDKEWVITGNSASDNYLIDMGLYIVQMIGTWNPGSVKDQLNQVLKIVHPDSYPKYRDQFKEVAERSSKYASVSFSAQWNPGQPIENHENTLTISATRRRITGQRVSRNDTVTYVIHYTIESGRFWIVDISETIVGKRDASEST